MDRNGVTPAEPRLTGWLLAASAQILAVAGCVWPWIGWWRTDANSAGAPPFWTALPTVLLLLGNSLFVASLLSRHRWRQREVQEALRECRARLQGVEELLDVWQWRTDAAHRIVEIRPPQGASDIDWRPADKALLWDFFKVEDEAGLRSRLGHGAPLEDIAVVRQVMGDATDEGRRHGQLRGRPVVDSTGAVSGHQGIVRERLAEARAAQTMRALEPAIAAAPAPSLDTSPEHESFSYTVSHDLRAPIRVVEGFTRIVKEDYGRLLDRVGNDHLDRVLGAAARMNNMIDALLALSKLASQPLARQPVDLSRLAGYVADDLRRQWPERAVQLTVEPGMQSSGDPTLLRVVLENLLGNAWKYTAKATQAHVWFERNPQAADTFTVRDNGAGFDMRFADRLFGVFQRLHSANDFPGTGIGLASVRRIVRRHGGEIWGEAEVNRGARFHFTLPQSGSVLTAPGEASSAPDLPIADNPPPRVSATARLPEQERR